jgi:hypothetical protein
MRSDTIEEELRKFVWSYTKMTKTQYLPILMGFQVLLFSGEIESIIKNKK